jgi:signal transduction histidine kinase
MSELITALLDFSTVGQEKLISTVDCGLLVEQVLKDMAVSIKTAGALITVSAMPTLQLYKEEFAKLLTHLLANAIKFTNGSMPPKIDIDATECNGEWRFSVKDNGIGIAPKNLTRIFQIFQRLYPVSEFPGSGIGLAICKKIVEFHQGKIWVTSTEGEGSIFYFTIPITWQ